MIEIITPADSYDLTTVDAIELRIGTQDESTRAKLAILIKSASDFVRKYCGREFAKETIKETLPGSGMAILMLSRTPIVSVSEILFDGAPFTNYVIRDTEAGFLYSNSGWYDTSLLSNSIEAHPIPNSKEPLYEVTYTGGYILPTSTGVRNLPYDLEEAVINLVRDQSERSAGNVKSVRIGDYSVTYGAMESAIQSASLTETKSILDNYRRIEF